MSTTMPGTLPNWEWGEWYTFISIAIFGSLECRTG